VAIPRDSGLVVQTHIREMGNEKDLPSRVDAIEFPQNWNDQDFNATVNGSFLAIVS
jgi:hypothetical protein